MTDSGMREMIGRLRAAGFELPKPTVPAGQYAPFTHAGGLVFIAGQTPVRDGAPQYCGTVGDDLTIEEAQQAAELCALNLLAQLAAACVGDVSRARRCLRIGVFVRCRADFTKHAQVADAASNIIVLALGDCGRYARTAVGTSALPRGVPLEIEPTFELKIIGQCR